MREMAHLSVVISRRVGASKRIMVGPRGVEDKLAAWQRTCILPTPVLKVDLHNRNENGAANADSGIFGLFMCCIDRLISSTVIHTTRKSDLNFGV
jgi:hypothetical protein